MGCVLSKGKSSQLFAIPYPETNQSFNIVFRGHLFKLEETTNEQRENSALRYGQECISLVSENSFIQ